MQCSYCVLVSCQVNDKIIEYACVLYDCELVCGTKHSECLQRCGEILQEVSGIQCEGWSAMKLATALKILIFPDDDDDDDDDDQAYPELVNHRPSDIL